MSVIAKQNIYFLAKELLKESITEKFNTISLINLNQIHLKYFLFQAISSVRKTSKWESLVFN